MKYQSRSASAGKERRSRRRRLVMVAGLAVGAVLATAVAANAAEGPRGFARFNPWGNHHGKGRLVSVTKRRPFIPTLFNSKLAFQTIDDRKDPTFNQLLGINDAGRIVGYFGSGADAAHPNKGFEVLSTRRGNVFLNENFPGSVQTQVVGINDAGTTVGFFVDKQDQNFGFVNRDGHFRAVTNPATPMTGRFNQLLGINDNDVAVGFYNDKAGMSHGYMYWARTGRFRMVRLPVKADSVTATGINDREDISGFFTVGKVTHGFVIINGHFFQVDLGGKTNTQVLGINNSDTIVGSFVDAAMKEHGFVWRPGSLRQIDEPWGVGGTVVNGLNNRNQIVGFYMDKAGKTHGFIGNATNVPAPPMPPMTQPTTMPTMMPSGTPSPMAPVPGATTPANGGIPTVQGTHN